MNCIYSSLLQLSCNLVTEFVVGTRDLCRSGFSESIGFDVEFVFNVSELVWFIMIVLTGCGSAYVCRISCVKPEAGKR